MKIITNLKITKWIAVFLFVAFPHVVEGEAENGLYPDLINLSSIASITSNATCGQYHQEYYCKLTEHGNEREAHCGVCDARSPDPSRRQLPENAIDGTGNWWQSPSLAEGPEFEFVTLTLDLQQVYQIAYVIVKSAISPRPGNWILERSRDDISYEPWQFFAVTDSECMEAFGIPPTRGRPTHSYDDEVICTSYFSKLNPLEGGEIHTSLINGRPGASAPSEELLKFTEARYVRLRLQKLIKQPGDLLARTAETDPSHSRRYFYSIKDISIGGRCVCNGHGDICEIVQGTQHCTCSHNTCGSQCEHCCPMFNQYAWRPGSSNSTGACEQCQCHNHALSCRYDPQVEQEHLSLNQYGDYEGGGVCLNCQHFTAGINCEKCKRGFYRPQGVSPSDPRPCLPCMCTGTGASGECIADDTQVNLGRLPGTCLCKEGFAGSLCTKCADGYLNYPKCDPCPCSRAGSKNRACEGECICKENVMGPRCDTCVPGTFHLDEYYALGCTKCFCNNVVDKCEAARLAVYTIIEREHWRVTDLQQRRVIAAAQLGSSVSVAQEDMSKFDSYFWLAPEEYLGKKLTSYGQTLTIKSSWTKLRGDTSGKPTRSPDVILEGGRFRIAYGGQYYPDVTSALLEIPLYEQGWYHLPKDLADITIDQPLSDYQLREVSREEMMEVLSQIKSMMIRARYHTEQVESVLHDVILEYGKEGESRTKAVLVTGAVERCFCPPGYSGLSCELCEPGYRRVNNIILGGQCLPCQCNGHVEFCDPFSGACGVCQHNTEGEHCERCIPGYYGDSSRGTAHDCKPCLCPLSVDKNEFVPKCVTDMETGGFKCLCPRGYEGPRCQHCADGYFGNPMIPGNPCRPCECGGNIDPRARGNCDRITGQCLKCLGNTAGFHCERCMENHYGDPSRGQCIRCACHEIGSVSQSCDPQTGQCQCKPLYAGRQCDRCESGRGGITEGCPPCMCDRRGSVTDVCDPVSGLCPCRPGVGGRHCDACLENHYGDIASGCSRLNAVRVVSDLTGDSWRVKFMMETDEGSGNEVDEEEYAVYGPRVPLKDDIDIEFLEYETRDEVESIIVDDEVKGTSAAGEEELLRNEGRSIKDTVPFSSNSGVEDDVLTANETIMVDDEITSLVPVAGERHHRESSEGKRAAEAKMVTPNSNYDNNDVLEQNLNWPTSSTATDQHDIRKESQNVVRDGHLEYEEENSRDSQDISYDEADYEMLGKQVEDYEMLNNISNLLLPEADDKETSPVKKYSVTDNKQGDNVYRNDDLNRSAKPYNHLTSVFDGKVYRHNHIRGIRKYGSPGAPRGTDSNVTVFGRWKYKILEDRENASTKTAIWPNKILTTENKVTARISTNAFGPYKPLLGTALEVPRIDSTKFVNKSYHRGESGGNKEGGDRSYPTWKKERTKLRIGHRYPDTFKKWRGLLYGCDCDERGSLTQTCDIVTGQCECRRNVVGRTCTGCKPGYWGIANGKDCQKCDCDVTGSAEGQCDDKTGQCKCRPGVGGPRCDHCLPGYWGFSGRGCKPCDPCGFPGRNCDPLTGKCVCPPNTEGDKCERCSQGFWDYSADIGCRPCRCSGPGSLERQCDPRTGQCVCREGFEAALCNECSFGYFGYPYCRPCLCNRAGTDRRRCREEGRCQCDENGQCPCKGNVVGRDCGKCKDGTFGLSAENPMGCYQCFCFKRTSSCVQAELTWSQLPRLRPRILRVEFKSAFTSSSTVEGSSADSQIIIRPWDTQEICYINLALPGERRLSLSKEETRLNITNQLYVIPKTSGDVTIGTSLPFLAPLYWQLPSTFMRDKTQSYNGYLRFRVQIEGNQKKFPEQILQSYPLVSLQGNWQLVLEYYPPVVSADGRYAVRFHEDLWRLKNSPQKVTREQMMIALQNVQHILIRATHSDDFTSAILSEVTLDVSAEGTPVSSRIALGVEKCFCPEQYSGLSCQNPNIGFYRWYKENHIQSQIIIDLVGESRPCDCNGRADVCDQETGICLNCRENTAGPHCEVCAIGYYGNPNRGRCKPCACPSRQQNFAETCQADPYSEYICHCRQGYTGDKCERCADGYYGSPAELGGFCKSCNCDPNGSIGRSCDSQGNCRCKPGILGRDCSQCAPRHVVAENGCISCEDGCVNILLDDVEAMINEVTSLDLDGFIPAPWPSLEKMRNYSNILASQLDQYESRVDVAQNMLLHFGLDNKARILHRKAEKMAERSRDNLSPSENVYKESLDIVALLKNLRVILIDSVSYLDHYGLRDTPTVSISAALDEAERILREIKSKSFREFDRKANIELERSKKLLDRVRQMQQSGNRVTVLFHRFNDLSDSVSDLLKHIRDSKRNTHQTKQLETALRNRIRRMRTHLDEVSDLNLYTEDRNFNTSRMVKRAERNLNNTYRNFNIITEMMLDLKNRSATLSESEATLWQLNNEYKDKYVKRAEDHALHLKAQAIKLEKLFNKTRDVADGPLRAAEAYQRIIDALRSAEEAAQNASKAATKAYDVAYPGDAEESLVRISKRALEESKDLDVKGDGLRDRVDAAARALLKHRRDLEHTLELVGDSHHRLDVVSQKLTTQFPRDLSRRIEVAQAEVGDIDGAASNTLEHVETIHHNLTIMKEYTSHISQLDSSLFQEIRDKIANIEGTTVKGQRLSANLVRQSNRIEVRSNNLKERIESLKRRITQTRQYASSIRVSLTTDRTGVCTRKYRPFLQPSTTSRLTLGYTINSERRDALLLFMSSNTSDYMAVEMRDRLIHFTWDAGGGPKTIMHPLRLETNNPLASDDTKWYHISVKRVGNIGELTVRPAFIKNSSRKQLYHEPVTGASPAGFSRMDIQPWDYTWIGGAPEQFLPKLETRNFAGCLHYVTIDGEPLGLWNFTESIGCDACNEGFELQVEEEDKTAFGFNGKGYFKGYNKIRRPKEFYSVVLNFKSLDEDALLFLAYNKYTNQYFTIGLEDGRVKFAVQFNEQTKLIMKSEKRLNNLDALIQIQAVVHIATKGGERRGRLVVGDQDQLGTIKGGPDLNLTAEPFYFGGVDPEFKRDQIGKQIELRSLLGCIGALSVLEVGKNPHRDGQYYGVLDTCPSEPLSDVGFLGQGFLEMPSQVLRRDSNFGFTFKTMESDALLMVSTFVGQPILGGVPNPPDFYSASLVEGHLDLQLFAGSQRHRIISTDLYNDGYLHSFFVLKENRKVRLFVDDQIVNSTRLDRGSHVVEAPREGGLFFGGVSPEINVGSMVGSSVPLKGCIQDVIINNMLLPFNSPIRFDNAFIGRCEDLPRNAMGGMESDFKHIVSCQPPKQHTVEYGALKFGDQLESHAVIPISKRTFRTDFELSFEFRTYYPSGLFFTAFRHRINRRNKKRLQLISAQLLNGRLQITMKNNRKEKKIISPLTGLNSGEWRKVIIEKIQRKLRVIVDDQVVNKEKIWQKNRFGNKLFIGGLPYELANASDIAIQEPFKGCFRNLLINNEKFEIPSLTRQVHIVGVGQCFASVQPGSYFPGDAYAIYDDNFQVGPLHELRLEFKTWELNGVLLSVSDPENNIALSLELHTGAVILTVNIGHNHPFSAQISLPNRYSLCDNQWHTIKAHYIKDSLTLKVDSYPEAYGFNGSSNLRKTITEAPLYIGGVPDSAPSGTLHGRENFKGCIRNIVLNSERKDWTDMYRLQNVLLNACPVL